MRKTFLYRARIGRQTKAACEQWLGLCCYLYNIALEQRIYAYHQQKKSISIYEQMRQLLELKQEAHEFKTVGSQVLQNVLERLDKAYKAFFRRIREKDGRAGFPRFRGKDSYNSFTLKQAGWQLEGRYLYIKNVGRFKLFLSRPIEGEIKTITISRTPSGKWLVAFSCDEVPEKPLLPTGREIGIDVGCESFLTDSNGDKIENPHFFKQTEDLLATRQQRLSRKVRGSNRREKARALVARAHEKVSNQRRDFHFKVAYNLVKNNDVICIEKMSAFKSTRGLNRSMRDVAWFGFFNKLRFKATEAGREVVEVPARNTSCTCSRCGHIVEAMLLEQREFFCPECRFLLDRDHNAALNILRVGQTLQCSELRISRL